ncbi:MAG: hypothetical protein R3F62_30695 [Planctomycetota bacterium]
MIYRFAPDWHGGLRRGQAGTLEPFLGLHYPASDIPRRAATCSAATPRD